MKKLYISPLVNLICKNNSIYICDDEIYKFKYDKNIFNAILKMKEGCSKKDIINIIGENTADELIAIFQELNLLKSSNVNNYRNTYVEKQVEYLYSVTSDGNLAQKKLEESTIAIVGVGGVGSVAIQHLVAAGIKSFILIDGDRVNLDNFNRQMIYNLDQIGIIKVEAAKEYIQRINSKAKVVTINKFISNMNDLHVLDEYHINFMICGADRPYRIIQEIISDYCYKRNIPSTYGMVGINCGNWGPVIVPFKDNNYKCYQNKCIKKMNEDEMNVYETNTMEPLTASFAITNTIIGTHMTSDVIKYLIGAKMVTGVVYSLDFNTLAVCKECIND